MPTEIIFPIALVHLKVGPGAVLGEPLFFPELSRLAGSGKETAASIARNLAQWLPKLDPGELLHRRRATTARLHRVTFTLDPPRKSEAWREPVELHFQAVVWEHGSFVLARIPELGIEIITTAKEDLDAALRREALAALRRQRRSASLKDLAGSPAASAAKLQWIHLKVRIPSLREREAKRDSGDEEKKGTLATVANSMLTDTLDPAYGMDEIVERIAESLTAKPPQSTLLVGPSGVGKTAAVRELVRTRDRHHLGATPFFRTSGPRIVAGQSGFGMWEERCQNLIREAAKKRAILHLGNLIELLDVGKSEFNTSGIASFLRPAIARGELLCIAECTPAQIPLIEKEDPQLLDAFRQVAIEEPDGERGRAILAQASAVESRREPTAAALAAVDRLHRRYATYSAYPGRPLRFLDNLRREGSRGTPIPESEVFEAFTRETGLPRPLIDPDVPMDLARTRAWFESNVMGQPEAVELVVDLIATVKSGLARPNRPLASLMFIGPTGVGKTEMAKALAEFLFGSRDRLTRFDMSEYADPISVRRLVGGAFGSEGLLTARVREQPFSVILLDEIEKADASIFDLLLQALGEARLTDAGGRLADFRNAVVIMTSNLGAESFRSGKPGFIANAQEPSDAAAHFTDAVERFLRPEMFNRLDRIVPFVPLTGDAIRSIAAREWRKVLLRDGVRFRGLAIDAGNDLLQHLATIGMDPQYGARPLKRAMERELLAPLARQINRHAGVVALAVHVGLSGGQPAVRVRPVPGSRSRFASEAASPAGGLAASVQSLRRWHQLLEQSSLVRELENEVYQLSLSEGYILKLKRANRTLKPTEQTILARLGRLRELSELVKQQRAAVFALEDDAVMAFHSHVDAPVPELQSRAQEADREWDRLLLRLYALKARGAARVSLLVFSESRRTLAELTSAYRAVAVRQGFTIEVVRYYLPGANLPPPKRPTPSLLRDGEPPTYWHEDRLYSRKVMPNRVVMCRQSLHSAAALEPVSEATLGFGLGIQGAGAHMRFGGEAGLHAFERPAANDEAANRNAIVQVLSEKLEDVRPSENFVRKGVIDSDMQRRVYDLPAGRIEDILIDRTWTGLTGRLEDDLSDVITANMRHRLMAMILE